MKILTHNELQTLESSLLAWSNTLPNNLEVQQELLSISKYHSLDDLSQIIETNIKSLLL